VKRTVNLGLIQMSCIDDKKTNFEKTVARIEQAAKQGAQIICTQELFKSLYFCQTEDKDQFALAEEVNCKTCLKLMKHHGLTSERERTRGTHKHAQRLGDMVENMVENVCAEMGQELVIQTDFFLVLGPNPGDISRFGEFDWALEYVGKKWGNDIRRLQDVSIVGAKEVSRYTTKVSYTMERTDNE